MTSNLLASLGIYGASFAIAFIAGLFPIASIELFLVGLSALRHPSIGELVVCCVLGALGHQVAKTITYFAGEGALENKKLKPRVDAIRHRIERWDRYPHAILFLSATVGLPPIYLIGFIAHPLMEIRFLPFTLITFIGRMGRYLVLAVIPLALRM
jgi:membrane protein YqaA with SNARE-associated domain